MPKTDRAPTLRWLAMFLFGANFKCPREDFSTLETIEFPRKNNIIVICHSDLTKHICQHVQKLIIWRQYPCRLGGWWTWLHFRNTYFGHQSCSNIQFTSTIVTQCQTVLIAKNARLQHDFHNIGLTRSKMIIPVPFSGIRVLHRNIFFGGYSGGHGEKIHFFVG